MFLTKKNAPLVNKGKAPPLKKRPLGGMIISYLGWEDDEETPAKKQATSKTVHVPSQQINLLEDNNEPSATKQPYQQQ